MKQLFAGIFAAFLSFASLGATTTPIQLLNPAGSTSGQVITSSGPTTAPAWATVTASSVGGLTAANNLSDLVSAASARTNLGLGTSATVNTGTSGATIPLLNAVNTWAAAQTFSVRPTFNGATPYDSANLTIANYAPLASPAFTGTATFAVRPTFNGATPWDSSNLATPQSSTGVTNGSSASAGQLGEYPTPTTSSGVSMTSGSYATCGSISLAAGDWDVQGEGIFTPAGSTSYNYAVASISTTAAANGGNGTFSQFAAQFGTGQQSTIPTPVVRISLSATTTVYLTATSNFTVSTMTCGSYVRARRIR